MSTIVAAYQPHYLPRLHDLARAQEADIFVVVDDVPFVHGSAHHRADVTDRNDEWLTVPVQHTEVDTTLVDARIDMSRPWIQAHLGRLRATYGDQALELAPFYDRLCPSVLDVEFVRAESATLLDCVDGDEGVRSALDEFTEFDEWWRRQRRTLNELQHEKNHVDEQIADRKRADPAASVAELTDSVTLLGSRVDAAEAICAELKRRRDDSLVTLSEYVASTTGAGTSTTDHAHGRGNHEVVTDGSGATEADSLVWMPKQELWNLDSSVIGTGIQGVALTDLTVPLLEEFIQRFGVTSSVVRSSELHVEHPGDTAEYLARLTETLGGDCYLASETGYENGLDEKPFDERGFDIVVQDWEPEEPGDNVCALDVLYGSDDPRAYI